MQLRSLRKSIKHGGWRLQPLSNHTNWHKFLRMHSQKKTGSQRHFLFCGNNWNTLVADFSSVPICCWSHVSVTARMFCQRSFQDWQQERSKTAFIIFYFSEMVEQMYVIQHNSVLDSNPGLFNLDVWFDYTLYIHCIYTVHWGTSSAVEHFPQIQLNICNIYEPGINAALPTKCYCL